MNQSTRRSLLCPRFQLSQWSTNLLFNPWKQATQADRECQFYIYVETGLIVKDNLARRQLWRTSYLPYTIWKLQTRCGTLSKYEDVSMVNFRTTYVKLDDCRDILWQISCHDDRRLAKELLKILQSAGLNWGMFVQLKTMQHCSGLLTEHWYKNLMETRLKNEVWEPERVKLVQSYYFWNRSSLQICTQL